VFSSDAIREAEALRSAGSLLRKASRLQIIVKKFRDGFLPYEGHLVKETFEELKDLVSPDLVLTHYRGDLHQDHRLISDLTWNTFRDHHLPYESRSTTAILAELLLPCKSVCDEKIEKILSGFPSQAGRRWFSEELFRSLLRLRGMECNAPSNYAEAFYCRKLILG
jgi:LmbE family N-acetylglucosaminyl deacetylase